MPTATAVLEKSELAEIGDVITLQERMKFQALFRSGFSAGLWLKEMELAWPWAESMRCEYTDTRFVVIATNDSSLRRDLKLENSPLFMRYPDDHRGERHVLTLVPLKENGDINSQGPVLEISQFPKDGHIKASSASGLLDFISPNFHKASSEVAGRINSRELMVAIQQQVDAARLATNEMFNEGMQPVLAGIRTLFEKLDTRNETKYLTDPSAAKTGGEDLTSFIAARLLAKAMEADAHRPLINLLLPPTTLAKPAA